MPSPHPSRRQFLAASAAAIATTTLPEIEGAPMTDTTQVQASDSDEKNQIQLAIKYGMFSHKGSIAEKFTILKEIGFDGVELDAPSAMDAEEVVAAQKESGLPVHGVVDSVHWRQPLSHPDPKVRATGLKGLQTAIRTAKAYGSSSVLLVPAIVSKHISYKEAWERSTEQVKLALPLADELDIDILFENVWNNFLLSPLEAANYIDQFENDHIGMYFDVGNVVRFGWPEHWIQALGHRVKKLDIKEYSRKLQNQKGPGAGFGVKIGDGDCDWPAVRSALDDINYSGWATAEVGGGDVERMKDIYDRMVKALRS